MEDCEVFICQECKNPKSFPKRYQYNQHMKSHEKPHRCALCEKAFSKKADLQRHRMTHISSAPRFKCHYPGCSFRSTSRKDYLRSHIKERHSSPNGTQDRIPKICSTRLDATEEQQSIKSMQQLEFLEAVAQGDEKELILLLSKSSINRMSTKDSHGLSLLHIAARAGNTHATKFFLQNGADVNASAKNSRRALDFAAQGGYGSVAELLLQNGANVNAVDYRRESALHYAAQRGCKRIVELLIQNGADVNAPGHYRSPLAYACQEGHKDIVEVLHQNGAYVESDDFSLAMNASKGGHEGTVKLLLRNGAYKNRPRTLGLALHCAVRRSNVSIARLLVDGGADVNTRSWYTRGTSLHIAAITSPEMTELLLQANASIEAEDCFGLKPLSRAIRRNRYLSNEFYEQTTKLLLEAGAKFSAADWNYLSPDRQEQFADHRPFPHH